MPFSVTDMACVAPAGMPRAEFRQSEIQQLHAALRNQNVAGLQIPVDDSFAMRGERLEEVWRRIELGSGFDPN